MWDILVDNFPAFLKGAKTTLALAFFSWGFGLLFGAVLGFLAWKIKFLTKPISLAGLIVASVPVLTFLFWFHYPLQASLETVINPFFTSVFIFSIINIFMVADTVLSSARQIPKEYLESARVYGLSPITTIRSIEFPLVMRASISSLLKIQVVVLHMTLFASLISVDELFRMAQRINSQEYRPTEIYTLIAIFYLIISLPIILLAGKLQKKFNLGHEK